MSVELEVQRLWIPHIMPGLNEILDRRAAKRRTNHYGAYASMKRGWEEKVSLYALSSGLQPLDYPAHFGYLFFEANKKRDPSNFLAGGLKFIEDALQDTVRHGRKILPNDGWANVLSISCAWQVRRDNPGVVVFMRYLGSFSPDELIQLEEDYCNASQPHRQRTSLHAPNHEGPRVHLGQRSKAGP